MEIDLIKELFPQEIVFALNLHGSGAWLLPVAPTAARF